MKEHGNEGIQDCGNIEVRDTYCQRNQSAEKYASSVEGRKDPRNGGL